MFNDTATTPSPLISLHPVTFGLGLPWWTQIPGVVINLLFSGYALGWSWHKRLGRDNYNSNSDSNSNEGADGHRDIDSNYVPPVSSLELKVTYIMSAILLIQNLSGLAHILANARSLDVNVQRVGAAAYTGVFANAIRVWSAAALERRGVKVLGWVNAVLGMVVFAVLSLPVVESAAVFDVLLKGGCAWLLNDGTGNSYRMLVSGGKSNAACARWEAMPNRGIEKVKCAREEDLKLGFIGKYANYGLMADGELMKSWMVEGVFSWVVALLIMLMLLTSAVMQFRGASRKSERSASGGVNRTVYYTRLYSQLISVLSSCCIGIAADLVQGEP